MRPKSLHPAIALLLSAVLLLSACSNTYERTVGGGVIGAGVGAAGGALCCHDPVNNTGKGALIGFAIGALVGYIYDIVNPNK